MAESIESRKDQIKKYSFNQNAGYAFISYSHKDADIVYPKVLEWLESGYNIYIDTDFEQHGSDENWVDIMSAALKSYECKMAICFKSENYLYSYAALIELLTMRRKKVSQDREELWGQKLPIDIITIGSGHELASFSSDEVQKTYQGYFEQLKVSMGSTFANNNKLESSQLKEGLEDWVGSLTPDKKLTLSGTAQEYFEDILAKYKASAEARESTGNFYRKIALIMLSWLRTMDLNGNLKNINSLFDARFVDLKIHKAGAATKALDMAIPTEKNEPSTAEPAQMRAAENLNIEKKKSGNNPHFSGKVTFTLYGQVKSGNQSDFLYFAFGEVLKRHPELLETVIQRFTCASAVDYTVRQNRTGAMPSYFRVCEHFVIDEKTVCIGGAYGMKDKLILVAKLLVLAGEPYDILKIEGMELPVIKNREHTQGPPDGEGGTSNFEYRIFGQIMQGNQSTMMWDFYEKLMEIYPDKAEDLTQLQAVARQSDVVSPNTKQAAPTYFRGCRLFQIGGAGYYVGTSFNKKSKYMQIQRMIEICHAPEDSFRIEGVESAESV